MKHFIQLIIFISIATVSKTQNLAIEPVNSNVLYKGIKNQLFIAVEGSSNDALIFKLPIGKITREGKKYFFYTDSAVGGCEISVYKKINNKQKLIGSHFYRIKPIPKPILKIGPRKDESIVTIADISHYNAVTAELEFFDPTCINYAVDSFTVYIYHDDSCKPIKIFNKTNWLNDEVKNEFSKLVKGDIIIFKNIHVRMLSDDCKNILVDKAEVSTLDPMTLYIRD